MGGSRSYSANPSDYKLLEEVGYGASATVYRAIILPTNNIVAVKCLDLDRCNNNLPGIILLDNNGIVKLADFGVSTCMFDMAPDILQPGSGYNSNSNVTIHLRADIYNLKQD
ncbi:hypothetical protein GOBAR_AA13472 [Gossypium barbadense]|uniref:Protein kinase domain-containing protein n=1 Tax=Gossypium barbadense TaxID=3634 RepID=A0A2P5XV01_GOSBA|nr:hypothetical protein GOBAR_AA13472 [Gossypium barbadense]